LNRPQVAGGNNGRGASACFKGPLNKQGCRIPSTVGYVTILPLF
jgi:hypothetical protein